MSAPVAPSVRWRLSPRSAEVVIWHDIECAEYTADLPLWRRLADKCPDGVLDIGAGTGRVALDLMMRGHNVLALDRDPVLLEELTRRAARLEPQPGRVVTVQADARRFELGQQFGLIVVPMQTIQLLGGAEARLSFLDCAARHLRAGGRVAAALTEQFDFYDMRTAGGPGLPPPDVQEVSGSVYRSQPTAVRREGDAVVLERRRERLRPDRSREVQSDHVSLDLVDSEQLEHEAEAVGLHPRRRVHIPPTRDHVGSVVVMLDA